MSAAAGTRGKTVRSEAYVRADCFRSEHTLHLGSISRNWLGSWATELRWWERPTRLLLGKEESQAFSREKPCKFGS